MLTNKEKQLLDALYPRSVEEGIEVVTVEVVGSKKSPTIRVYIDAENGVSFDELASAQAWINEIMDELDPFPGAYMLEVSSPGIDRPLRTAAHFARFVGEEAAVKMASPVNDRSNFTGIINGVEGENVLLDVEGEQVALPLANMKRARLKGRVDFSK